MSGLSVNASGMSTCLLALLFLEPPRSVNDGLANGLQLLLEKVLAHNGDVERSKVLRGDNESL